MLSWTRLATVCETWHQKQAKEKPFLSTVARKFFASWSMSSFENSARSLTVSIPSVASCAVVAVGIAI